MSRPPADWTQAWDEARRLWSPALRLRPPVYAENPDEARHWGLDEGLALIRLDSYQILVNRGLLRAKGLEDRATEILAHEIGHHVYAPANLRDHGRCLARMRVNLPRHEARAPEVANLYTDWLINHRLWTKGRDLARIYRSMDPGGPALWRMYLRAYELLWNLPRGDLGGTDLTEAQEGDARLCARLVRRWAEDWLEGAAPFAALCLPYYEEGEGLNPQAGLPGGLGDLGPAGEVLPEGLARVEGGEGPVPHPALEPSQTPGGGQARQAEAPDRVRSLQEYLDLLSQLGWTGETDRAVIRYYKELVAPYLIPFPKGPQPRSTEREREGFTDWMIGDSWERLDWTQSLIRSPVVIPGLNTLQAEETEVPGALPAREVYDLDLYLDSSGSVPDPRRSLSPLTWAGAVVALSALRAGARVHAVLWSGPGQVTETHLTSREADLWPVLLGYYGGGTAFPSSVLEASLKETTGRAKRVLCLSDEGIDTLYRAMRVEQGRWLQAEAPDTDLLDRLDRLAPGGLTLALQLAQPVEAYPELGSLRRRGWLVERVNTPAELLAFARAFARRHWGPR